MYRYILVFLSMFIISMAFNIDLTKEYEKAETELALKDKERMISGATSKRFHQKRENRM